MLRTLKIRFSILGLIMIFSLGLIVISSEYIPMNENVLLISFGIFISATIPFVLLLWFFVYSGLFVEFFLEESKDDKSE